MENTLRVNQIVRIKGDAYIRKILSIRNGEALTVGADKAVGYIKLECLEPVPKEEIEEYKKYVDGTPDEEVQDEDWAKFRWALYPRNE